MNLVALKAELLAGHPGTGAYDADAAVAADQLNAVNRTRIKSSMTGDELFVQTNAAEFAALTDAKKAQWLAFTGKDVNPGHAANVSFVQYIFGGGATTVSNLAAARTENISRAEELGLGTVRSGEVISARAS